MACTRTYATLRIFSKDIHPDEITNVLGVSPTSTRPIEPDSKYENRRIFHFWALTTEKVSDSVKNIEHIELILSALEGKAENVEMLRNRGCDTDIFCYWDSTGQGGPSVTVELMKRLIKYGLAVSWDIYFDGEDDA